MIFNRTSTPDLGKLSEKYCKKSFSQCGEDLIISHLFHHIGIDSISYLDVGAHHPFNMSNTALFYGQGFRGINIEPDPNLILDFNKYRTYDLNLNVGISDESGASHFYILSNSALNTFSRCEADAYCDDGFEIVSTVALKTFRLDDVVNKYCDGKYPSILSLDAEGLDERIIKSIDFKDINTNPKVICLETVSHLKGERFDKNLDLISYVCSKGYTVYGETFVNTIFIQENLL